MTANTITFTKMHGLGNDFMVVNALSQPLTLDKAHISHLSDRHRGVGFDQLLVIEPSTNADFFCRIFNADGSEAEQCGNGLRCIARYVHEEKMALNNTFSIETKAGVFPVEIKNYEHIQVTMGTPEIQESLIALEGELSPLQLSVLSMGNPHAIVKMDAIDSIHAEALAMDIAALPYFPNGANVGFMQIIHQGHIRLRTIERGAGETFACGSNACAAVVAGILNHGLASKVTVEYRYGSLVIEQNGNELLVMAGPAKKIFTGKISLDD